MARTPSMTVGECEAILGARGQLRFVGADNHSVARKWLTANGVKGMYAAGLARKHLLAIYNDLTDTELSKVRNAANEAANEYADDNAANSEAKSSPDIPAATATDDKVAAVSKVLADLLAGGAVNPEQVAGIVRHEMSHFVSEQLPEMIAKHSPITRIEIVRTDGQKYEAGRQHKTFGRLVKAMGSRMLNGWHPNIMLVGPTGSGKTHAFYESCKALGIEGYANGALSMDHQVLGYRDANGTYHETPFRKAFDKPAGYLFDEFDSSDNSPLLALAGALANGHFDFPDGRIERHKDSVIVFAGNTWGLGATADFVGRAKIDAAILSRAPIRIQWDYDESLERDMSGNVDWACRVQAARAKAKSAGLKVIIDPRMTQAGAGLIAAGFTEEEAAEMTYLANLSPDQRKMIEA